MQNGRVHYISSYLKRDSYENSSSQPLPTGTVTLRFELDDNFIGKGFQALLDAIDFQRE